MQAVVEDVTMFVKLLATTMPRAEYEALPDRQGLLGLPVDGVTYRDSAHPGLIFRCHAGINWTRYGYHVLQPQLLD